MQKKKKHVYIFSLLTQIMHLSYYEFDLVNYLIKSILEEFMDKKNPQFPPGNGLV